MYKASGADFLLEVEMKKMPPVNEAGHWRTAFPHDLGPGTSSFFALGLDIMPINKSTGPSGCHWIAKIIDANCPV